MLKAVLSLSNRVLLRGIRIPERLVAWEASYWLPCETNTQEDDSWFE